MTTSSFRPLHLVRLVPRGLQIAALLLSACFAFSIGRAETPGTITGTIVGRVTDATSKVAFDGVRVTVTVNGTQFETTTDQQGSYVLVNVPPGDMQVAFTYLGLPAQTMPAKVNGGQVTHLDLAMGQGLPAGRTDDTVKLGELVVSGSLLGTARAMNDKRNAPVLTEMLASDAIGQLPDKNMVEAIQRLPGIEIVKDKGEGRYVSPRGIAPVFVGMSLNGVRFSSTEKGTRESSMDVVSASLIGSLAVDKVNSPDRDGDDMGGSVDLKTRSGFDQEGRVLRFNAGGLYSHTEYMKGGYNVATSYADQFLGGRLGVSLDLAADYRPYTDYAEKPTNWALAKSPTDGQQHWLLGSLEFDHYDVKRNRQGGALSIDYKLNDTGRLYLRVFDTSYYTGNQQWADIFAFSGGTVTALTDQTATSTLKASGGLIKSETQIRNNKRLGSIVAGYDQTTGPWTNNFIVAYTHAKYTRPTLNVSFANAAAVGVSYDLTRPYLPQITQVSGAPIGSPSSYVFNTKSAYSNTTANNTERTIKDDVRRDFVVNDIPAYVKAGASFRDKDTNLDGSKWNITKVPWALDASSIYPGPDLQDTQGGFDNFRIRQEFVQGFYNGNQSQYGLTLDPKTTYGTAFVGHEEISSGYGMGGLTLGQLKGMAGVRVENTNYRQTGWQVNATTGAITPVSNHTNYDNVMPSVITTYEFDSHTIFRASWSNTIARPDYNAIAPGRSIDDSKKTVSQGNVNLPALTAVNWDASIEHFYGKLGVVSAAVFYKTIKNFSYQAAAGIDPDTGYQLTSYLTAPSAWLDGLELSWRQQLSFLPGALKGLGLQANVVIGNSEISYPTRPGETLRFPGYGHKLGNFIVSYDYQNLSLRAAVHFHDSRVLARSTIGANYQQDEMEPAYHQIDLSSSYRISQRWRVYLNGSNVNSAPLQQFLSGTPGLTRFDVYEAYGWAAEGGVTWNY